MNFIKYLFVELLLFSWQKSDGIYIGLTRGWRLGKILFLDILVWKWKLCMEITQFFPPTSCNMMLHYEDDGGGVLRGFSAFFPRFFLHHSRNWVGLVGNCLNLDYWLLISAFSVPCGFPSGFSFPYGEFHVFSTSLSLCSLLSPLLHLIVFHLIIMLLL